MTNFQPDWAIHPGEMVREYRKEIRISPHDLAGETGLTVGELYDLESGKTDIDDFLAEKLSEVFGTSKQFWFNLQANYNEDYIRINSTK